MVGLSRVKDHQKLWFQSKNKRLKPMVHNGHTLKSCSHRRQTMTTTTSKSLTREIDLDGSSRNGKYETRWRQKDVDWYGLYRNDLPCLYASMSPVSNVYVILQENLLVWHKISKCTTPQDKIVTTALRKLYEKSTRKNQFETKEAFKAQKKRKKTLIESSWKVKESPLNCNRTSICYGDVYFIGINRLRNQIKQRRSYQI